MRIGDFAQLAGTNQRTLRYYEQLGLLAPTSRSAGGSRYHDRSQLDRMTAIRRLKGLGLSLKDVAATLPAEEPDGGPTLLAMVEASSRRQIALVEQKIAELR